MFIFKAVLQIFILNGLGEQLTEGDNALVEAELSGGDSVVVAEQLGLLSELLTEEVQEVGVSKQVVRAEISVLHQHFPHRHRTSLVCSH